MIKRLLYIVNLFFVFLLLGVYVSVRVSPEFFAELSLLSYIYPLLLVINVLFCVLWLFLKWKYLFVPLAVVLIGASFIPRFIGFNSEDSEAMKESLCVMTYNVKSFSQGAKDDRTIAIRNKDSILSLIEMYSPDVVCLQEYSSVKNSESCFHFVMTNDLGYSHFFAPDNAKNYVRGSVIYSKYPITRSGALFPMSEEYYSKTYADIVVNKKKFRVYNVHLDSYKLSDEEKEEVNRLKDGEITSKETGKGIIAKLLETNKEQAKEVRDLKSIFNETECDFVLMGDFNATPYSYTYEQLSKGLKDSFVERGRGFSGTHNDLIAKFRIDYVLVSEKISVVGYRQECFEYSDHNPVVVNFKLERGL